MLPASFRQWTLLFITGLGLAACKTPKVASATAGVPIALVTQGPLWGAVFQQKAAEYKALCFQAYNIARLRLDALPVQQGGNPRVIVTDIDETVLDNSPYAVHQALRNEGYSDKTWMEWTARVECDTVPGALSFLKYASSKGVQVFYITNRLEAERDQTLKNLQHWNFPDAVGDHLFLKQNTSGKEPRRKMVAANHDIIMLMGDNLNDFSEVFDKQPYDKRDAVVTSNAAVFGNRFIVLPNADYGDWESTLYHFNYQLSPAQKDSAIIQQLRTY